MWVKSSYSGNGGGNCVEVRYAKSSRSGERECVEVAYARSARSGDQNCVEAGAGACGQVHVRDSKDPAGPVLTFSPAEWGRFTASLH